MKTNDQEIADVLGKFFQSVFTMEDDSGVVPSQSMAGNYRPVSLTCLASKLMESCVKDAMLKHLLENNLNTPD